MNINSIVYLYSVFLLGFVHKIFIHAFVVHNLVPNIDQLFLFLIKVYFTSIRYYSIPFNINPIISTSLKYRVQIYYLAAY